MVSQSHPKSSEYNRRSQMRRGILALATIEGWQRLDVLEGFIRPDGSVIVIDTENRRYVTGSVDPLSASEIVMPEERPTSSTSKKSKKSLTWPKGYRVAVSKIQTALSNAPDISRDDLIDAVKEKMNNPNDLNERTEYGAMLRVLSSVADAADWADELPDLEDPKRWTEDSAQHDPRKILDL